MRSLLKDMLQIGKKKKGGVGNSIWEFHRLEEVGGNSFVNNKRWFLIE